MFLMTQGIFLDKPVCCQNNVSIGTKIFFHKQHFRSRMMMLKFQQCLRVSGTKSINALILISHHKKILGFRCQKRDDGMLDFRCILGFIHTDIRVFLLKICKKFWNFPKHIIGIDHLVIIIHKLLFPELSAVLFVDRCQMNLRFFFQLLDFFFIQHPVFYVSNQCPDIFQITFCWVYPLRLLINARQHGRNPLFIREQLKCRPARLPAIVLNHPGTDAVDGSKFQTFCHLLSEFCRKPICHILRCRHRVGNCQNFARVHSFTIDHVTQPRHQHCRFPRSRHRQKKHWPVHTLHGTFLLLI